MNTHLPPVLCLLALAGLHSPTWAQEKPKPTPKQDAAQDPGARALLEKLREEGIEVDLKNKRMSIPVVVNRVQNDLEYLLIYKTGKKHESMMVTDAKPSLISVGLVLLGAQRGKNAAMKEKDPLPTEEQMRAGVSPYIFIPPQAKGPKLFMTVRYKDHKGRQVEKAIEELILDYEANLTVTDNAWVFLGGRMAQLYRNEPEVFMANYEGNLISICYMHPPNHILTMMHERGRDEMNWLRSDHCPPPGTEMSLIFHTTEPEVRVDYRKRMAKEAAERKKKGIDPRTGERPTRNPARPQGAPPPVERKQGEKKEGEQQEGKAAEGKKQQGGGTGPKK